MLSHSASRIFNIFAFVVLFSTFGALVLIGYWLFYPYNPVTFTFPKSRILNPNHQVHRGEPILLEVDATYERGGVPVQIDRRIVDDFVFYTTQTSIITTEGHTKYTQSAIAIPPYLPYGTYHELLFLTFKVNPIRSITVVRESEDFQVVPFHEGDTLQQENDSQAEPVPPEAPPDPTI